jgi:putative alpha-1,2-mannosidase
MPGILRVLQKGTEIGNLPAKAVPHGSLSLAPGTYVAASAGGDKAATGSGILLLAQNGNGSAVTVTLAVPETVNGLLVQSREITDHESAALPGQQLGGTA